MARVYVIHENDAWMQPLREALVARELAYTEWHLRAGAFDLDRPPPPGVFYNRMSASSHTRGHRYAPEFATALIGWLEAHGRRVVNGGNSTDLEINKGRQYASLRTFGVTTPRTHLALGKREVVEAAHSLGPPLVLKPNRGGKGLGVLRFDALQAVEAHVYGDDFDPGPDGTVLVQQFVASTDSTIIRNEFVGGRFLYSVQVNTGGAFELCPAEACAVGDLGCPVGESPQPMFTILQGYTPPDLERYQRCLAANEIEVAGIEMIRDEHGRYYTYDINTNTNYNAEAEQRAGLAGTDRAGMGAIAGLLGGELARLYPEARDAA